MVRLAPRGRTVQEALWGYLLIAPTLILLGIFFYLALGASLLISFTDWEILTEARWVGLRNYERLLQDKVFLQSLWNSARYVLMSIPIGQSLSLLLALALNARLPLRNLFRLVYFLPVLTMSVAIAVVWKWIYNPAYGPLALLFQWLGWEPLKWLSDVNLAMWSIVIINVWLGIGYNMVIMLAGLQNIPRDYYEAAQVDGANRRRQFWHITLPLLTPTLFFTTITSFINGLQLFDMVFIMTQGGPLNTTRTVVFHIYEEGIKAFRAGSSSAAAWILFVIIMAVTLVQLRMQRRWVHYD
jgi:multiple sugar transport system permease protein